MLILDPGRWCSRVCLIKGFSFMPQFLESSMRKLQLSHILRLMFLLLVIRKDHGRMSSSEDGTYNFNCSFLSLFHLIGWHSAVAVSCCILQKMGECLDIAHFSINAVYCNELRIKEPSFKWSTEQNLNIWYLRDLFEMTGLFVISTYCYWSAVNLSLLLIYEHV